MQPDVRCLADLREYCTFSREPFFRLAIGYHRPGGRVLDIGAGSGGFADLLGDPEVFLLDGNPRQVEQLRTRYPNAVLYRVPDPLPFSDRSFQLIHCSHLVEHLAPAEVYALLQEVDRCLEPEGVFVVSAPVMWSGFFDDLSHVRPYNPAVFEHYLCGTAPNRPGSREQVSSSYEVVALRFRYTLVPIHYWSISYSRTFLHRLLFSIVNWLREHWLAAYEVTGYTLVLRKGEPSSVSSQEGQAETSASPAGKRPSMVQTNTD